MLNAIYHYQITFQSLCDWKSPFFSWPSPSLLQRSRSPEPVSPRVSRGVDDSVIFSPPDGVVLRKKNIKKFNTVAYRGDSRPNKWKRASINGHIYNFDVSAPQISFTCKLYYRIWFLQLNKLYCIWWYIANHNAYLDKVFNYSMFLLTVYENVN